MQERGEAAVWQNSLSELASLFRVCVLQAVEVERAMSNELQALKQERQQKGSHNRLQDEELISAMREQVNQKPKGCVHKKEPKTQGVGAFANTRKSNQ